MLAGINDKEIMKEQENSMGDNALKLIVVFEIVKRVKEGADLTDNRGKFDHKFMRTEELVEEVTRLFRSIVELTFPHWSIISWSWIEPFRKLSPKTPILSKNRQDGCSICSTRGKKRNGSADISN